MPEVLAGEVTHYLSRLEVAVLSLQVPLRKGVTVHIVGHTTDLHQTLDSMGVERQPIEEAKPGDDVAVKVQAAVREGDKVYIESPEG